MIQILIERCGGTVSIQDAGRRGWGHIGLPRSGALDVVALAVANALVGNPSDAAAIEFCLSGATLRVAGGNVRMALAGAPYLVRIDDALVSSHSSFMLESGQRLKIQPSKDGACAILAVEGSFDIPAVLGSRSLYRRGEIGGHNGRNLQDGDLLTVKVRARTRLELECMPVELKTTSPVRVVMGPQVSHFSDSSVRSFLTQCFTLTHESDRMGYRLGGKPVRSINAANMISDGIAEGSVQITGSGLPIVLLADHQTTGGYPKIATVISPDIRLIAQRRPGDSITFKAIEIADAQEEVHKAKWSLDELIRSIAPKWDAAPLNNKFNNIADSAVNAFDPHSWEWRDPGVPMPLAPS